MFFSTLEHSVDDFLFTFEWTFYPLCSSYLFFVLVTFNDISVFWSWSLVLTSSLIFQWDVIGDIFRFILCHVRLLSFLIMSVCISFVCLCFICLSVFLLSVCISFLCLCHVCILYFFSFLYLFACFDVVKKLV